MSDSKIFSDEEEAISEVKEKQAIPAYRFSERRCYNPVELPDEKHEERRTSIVEEPYNIFTSPETSAISLIDEVRGIKINDEMLSSSSSLLKFFDSSNIDYAEDFPEGLTAEFRSLDVYYRFHVAKLVRSVLKGRPIVNDIFTLSKIAKKNPEICSYKYETQVVFQALSETGFEQQNFNDENYKMLEQILLNNKVHLKSAISKTLIRHKVNSLAELITGCGDKNQTIATTPNESCPEIFAIFVNTFLCPKEKLLSLLEENGMKMYMEASCLERTGPIEMRKYLQEFTSSDCHFLPDPDYPNIFLFKQSFRDKLLTLDLVKEKKAVPIGLSMISTANLALKRIFDERRIEAFVDDSTPQTCAVSYERSGSAIVLVYMAVLWAEKCKNRSADRMSIFIENYDTRRKVKSALQEYNIFSRKISMNSSPLSETYSKELASRISAPLFSPTLEEKMY